MVQTESLNKKYSFEACDVPNTVLSTQARMKDMEEYFLPMSIFKSRWRNYAKKIILEQSKK